MEFIGGSWGCEAMQISKQQTSNAENNKLIELNNIIKSIDKTYSTFKLAVGGYKLFVINELQIVCKKTEEKLDQISCDCKQTIAEIIKQQTINKETLLNVLELVKINAIVKSLMLHNSIFSSVNKGLADYLMPYKTQGSINDQVKKQIVDKISLVSGSLIGLWESTDRQLDEVEKMIINEHSNIDNHLTKILNKQESIDDLVTQIQHNLFDICTRDSWQLLDQISNNV